VAVKEEELAMLFFIRVTILGAVVLAISAFGGGR
jgi:hypothetical protein